MVACIMAFASCKKSEDNNCDGDKAWQGNCYNFASVKHSFRNNIEAEHRWGAITITAKNTDSRQNGFILSVKAKGVTDFFSVTPATGTFEADYTVTLNNGAAVHDYGYFTFTNLKVTKIDAASRTVSFSFDKINASTSNGSTEIKGTTFTDIKVE